MEEIINLLKTNDIEGALKLLTTSQISNTEIENLQKEHIDLERNIRQTQVGNIQRDKTIKKDGQAQKIVKAVKIPIPLQNKIVNISTAFEIGKPVTLTPNEDNDLTIEILRLWRENRIDSKIQKMVANKKSELQCALLFYIEDLKQGVFNRIIGSNSKKEIKSRLLLNKNGVMSPMYDSAGDMIFFTWQFDTIEAGKKVNNVWVYGDTSVYKASNVTGSYITETLPHGFGKIPIVYVNQDKPEWFIAQSMIDRLEVAISKLGASNDYSGHPILKLTGNVIGAPEKDEDGKALALEIKQTDEGNVIESKAEYLTYDNAPESVKLELDKLEKFIYSLTSTPDISFDNLKGVGNISGIALNFMFMDAITKALMNEGDNRTMVSRVLNILISGTVTTTTTKYKSYTTTTYFDIVFNSVLPNDLAGTVKLLKDAVGSGFLSIKTAVKKAAMTNDDNQELDQIISEKVSDKKPEDNVA